MSGSLRGEVEAERPGIVAGYGIRRGPEGLLSWDLVEERMGGSRNYWIHTTRPDGGPHAAPVWGVWFEGVLYFGTDRESVKARNLAGDPRMVAHAESGDEAVIVEGVAEEVADADLRRRVGAASAEKYGMNAVGGEGGAPLYAVRAGKVLAWSEADFPNTATRWRFAEG